MLVASGRCIRFMLGVLGNEVVVRAGGLCHWLIVEVKGHFYVTTCAFCPPRCLGPGLWISQQPQLNPNMKKPVIFTYRI